MRKRVWQKAICFLMILLLVMFSAQAYTEEDKNAQIAQTGADRLPGALPESSKSIMNGIDLETAADLNQSIATLAENLNSQSGILLENAFHSLTKVLLVAVLIGCLTGLQKLANGPGQVVQIAGALAITGVLYTDLAGMMQLCTSTLSDISVFSRTLIPVLSVAVSMSGTPTTATMMQAATLLSFGILTRFITSVLVPAVSAYIAIITVNAALGNDILGNLASFLKWLMTGSLKLIMTLFIAYLSLSGLTGGSVDALAVKTAKFAVSGSVPVVGGIISDAAESMLAGAVVIKNTIGIFGMICVISICILPFLKVGINYLVFKAGSALITPVCGSNLAKLLSGLSDSFGMLLGMLGTCCAVLFFEILLMIAMVKPI